MEQVLDKKAFSEKTKKVYVSVIKRLEKLAFKFPIKKKENLEYIKTFFGEHFPKVATKLDALNIIIVIRAILEQPVDNLKLYRSELSRERLVKNVDKMNDAADSIIEVGEFQEELIKSFEKNEWKKFIVNYLFFTFGVRNMDVDVEIVKNKADMLDPKQNYLLLKTKDVTYYRNHYKTVKTHGKQMEVITDPEFRRAVKMEGIGRLFKDNQLSNGLRKLLIHGMNEARIFKMLIDAAYETKDTEEINRLAKSRGTSIAIVKSFYNLNAEQEVIREM